MIRAHTLPHILSSIFLIVSLFADESPQWSIDHEQAGWNDSFLAETYFHHSELQRQWAWELFGKFLTGHGLQGNETILDFGCGDGKITAELSRLIPSGSIEGVDISGPLLRIAKLKFPAYAYPNLRLHQTQTIDFSDHPPEKKYDIITSLCVFHVLSQPNLVLENLKKHLKKNGKLLLIIPAGKNPLLFQTASELFPCFGLTSPWAGQPATALSVRTEEGCKTLLENAGFHIHFLSMVDTDNPFYSKIELIQWLIGTTAANWNIPPHLATSFFSTLVEKMISISPEMVDQEGRIHFKLSRLYVIATAS